MKHRRFAPLLATLAAAGYAVEGAIVVRAPQPDHGWHASGYAVEGAFVVALLASLPLVAVLRSGRGRLSAAAVWFARCGFAAMLVSATASLAAGGDELGPAFFLGVLAALVGLIVLSAIAVRTRALGWWQAPIVAAGLVLSIALGDHGGGILFASAWAAVGLALHDTPETEAVASATA